MRQLTAKTVEEVLRWIESKPHHRASWVEEPGFFVLTGRGEKLRIPEALQEETRGLVESGGSFDTRMFRANKAGRARLRRAALQKAQP